MSQERFYGLLESMIRDVQFDQEESKQAGIQRLARAMQEDTSLFEAAPSVLKHENWRVRYLTLRAMEEAAHPALKDALAALSQDDSPEVRATIKRLGAGGSSAALDAGELTSLLTHPSWWVRKKAVLGLGSFGGEAVRQTLSEHLGREEDEEVRQLTNTVLGDLRQSMGS